jgi:hypothetical protein
MAPMKRIGVCLILAILLTAAAAVLLATAERAHTGTSQGISTR